MRRLGRLSSAALVGPAVVLIAACGHAAPAPASPTQPAAPTVVTSSALPSTPAASAGISSGQISQIDNQIGQIDNQITQANQGLSTSEGDPTQ